MSTCGSRLRNDGRRGYEYAAERVPLYPIPVQEPMSGTVLVRQTSSRLAEGIVTHIGRVPVDVALAQAQHAAYADALATNGWTVQQVPAADDCPDSVFVEDTVVVCEDLAVLAHPGAPARRAEVAGVAQTVQAVGLRTARIEESPASWPSSPASSGPVTTFSTRVPSQPLSPKPGRRWRSSRYGLSPTTSRIRAIAKAVPASGSHRPRRRRTWRPATWPTSFSAG